MQSNPTPLNPRHARMLAQAAFEDAADSARDGDIATATKRAEEGIETLRHRFTFPDVHEVAA